MSDSTILPVRSATGSTKSTTFDRVDREFDRVHQDIRELRQWIFRLTIGMSVGFISVLSAILVRGA